MSSALTDGSQGRWLRLSPSSKSSSLPVSTVQWTASASMAEPPVKTAATNLQAAIARLAAMAG